LQSKAHPSLVYGRIAQNRRDSVLIAVLLVTALAPFVLGVSYLISARLVRLMGSQTLRLSNRVRAGESSLKSIEDQPGGESWEWLKDNLAKDRAALAESREADRSLFLKLMPVAVGGLAAALGLLFWGTCSSPTTSLLAQLGALPAGRAGAETARLLEELSIQAGLPRPSCTSSIPVYPLRFLPGLIRGVPWLPSRAARSTCSTSRNSKAYWHMSFHTLATTIAG
jgi:hypothetical protein